MVVRPHISGSSDEQEDEQLKSSTSSSGSGINGGYLMLGLAGPLLFIIFRLRKFFRLRNNKDEREAEFAQIARWIAAVAKDPTNADLLEKTRVAVAEMMLRFPVPA